MMRAILAASIVFGLAYPLIWNAGLPPAAEIGWKGAPVALLALWAALQAEERDGWLLAAVLALGAIGDVLLEVAFTAGAASFALGHVVAIWLYVRNRRERLTRSQALLALLLVPLTVAISAVLPADRAQAPGVTFYSLLLAAMAAAAWTSRFPRYRAGIGAMLFLASDLLIFARMGPLAGAGLASYAIWLSYYTGQLLIALGVRQGLARGYSSSPSSSSSLAGI